MYLVVGQDDKAVNMGSADEVARSFREPWDIKSLREAVSVLLPGSQLVVDGATVVRLNDSTRFFR